MLIAPADRLQIVEEYYFSRKLREISQRIALGEPILNMGIGNPDMAPSDPTLKGLVNSALEHGNHGYQPYKGIPQLRAAFSNWYLDTYGVTLDPEQEILPLMGSKEGVMHVSMAFLNPGDQVLMPNPGYPTYASITRLLGAEPVWYDLREANNWYPDLEALEQQDLSRVKMMWINYPHMPTGAPATDQLFESLIAFGKKHRILICHDNPYSLVLNKSPKSILAYPDAREIAVELNSLSKSHNMAGWRVGMVAGDVSYINAILKVKSNMDSGMFRSLQDAAVAALGNGYAWHEARNDRYLRRREVAWKILDALDCVYQENQAGMFVWAKIPDHAASAEAYSEEILNRHHLFLTPGFIFGSQGDRYLRISLCSPTAVLQEALNRLQLVPLKE
jgi:LL-diaminopimelate aminotransferase